MEIFRTNQKNPNVGINHPTDNDLLLLSQRELCQPEQFPCEGDQETHIENQNPWHLKFLARTTKATSRSDV